MNEPVVFQLGSMIGTMQCVEVSIMNEDVVENDEIFNADLSSVDPGVEIPAAQSQATATIINDDSKLPLTVSMCIRHVMQYTRFGMPVCVFVCINYHL